MAALVDDRALTVDSIESVAEKRETLVQFLWGSEGFPVAKLPTSVERDVSSPVPDLESLARADLLRIEMDAGEHVLAYHLIPTSPNHRLVIVHHGHGCSFHDRRPDLGYDSGLERTIDALLRHGYSVLAIFMPRFTPDRCIGGHNYMSDIATTGSPLKFFLEGIAVGIHYLKSRSESDDFPWYVELDMLGLSGGGWATTVYAAIDPTIRLSVPVAGSKPLYMRARIPGDFEQSFDPFYALAGYPDLYLMGGAGVGREQVQVLNRHDTCCWGENQHNWLVTGVGWEEGLRDYEARVQNALGGMGEGSFRVHIDEVADQHQISDATIEDVILRELALRRTCPPTPGGCTPARKSTLIAHRDPSDPRANRLWWAWHGPDVAAPDAAAATEYIACIYSGDTLVTHYTVGPAGDCGGRPCWEEHAGGALYRNHPGNGDGISRLKIRPGRVLLRGEGSRLTLRRSSPLFAEDDSVSVQLIRTDASQCWQATFAAPARTSSGERFRDSMP